jgi:hypothetical protein
MAMPKVTITKHWHDGSETIGYAEGELSGREFTASWATWCPIGALFYDTWLDSTRTQDKAIAAALKKLHAVPAIQVA